MKNMIIISRSDDREFSENIEKLHRIIPVYAGENDLQIETNPFMDYVLEKDSIRQDLYEFLYHSDFLQDLTEKSLPLVKELYDRNASIEWFSLFQTVLEEKDDGDDYCHVIIRCFREHISIEDVTVMFEINHSSFEMSINVDKYLEVHGTASESFHEEKTGNRIDEDERDMYSQLMDQQKELIAQLQDENEQLKQRLSITYDKLESAYSSVRESREECLQYAARLRDNENHSEADLQMVRDNSEQLKQYVKRIKELEETVSGYYEEAEEHQHSIERIREEVKLKDQMISDLNASLREKSDALAESLEKIEHLETVNQDNSYDGTYIKMSGNTGHELLDGERQAEFFGDTDKGMSKNGSDPEPDPELDADVVDAQPIIHRFKGNLMSKASGFIDFLYSHSSKAFGMRSRSEQENMIFIKMMEMQFSVEKTQFVKRNMNDNIPCFELYKLISRNPDEDELSSFFSTYSSEMMDDKPLIAAT